MTLTNWKISGNFLMVLLVFLSYYQMANTFDMQAKQAPAGQRPIANGPPKPASGNVAGEIVVEIQTPPSNINSVVNVKPADNNRPISPTPKPPGGGSAKPPPKPSQKPKPPAPGGSAVINVMSIKTGLLSAANDPCSYVSCIRADSYLFCALVKCDPGQAFSQASLRCMPSPQCPAKPSASMQSKPSPQKLPQKPSQSPPKPQGQSKAW